MAAPNMALIAASLERSLQNCSLNHQQSSSSNSSTSSTSGGGDEVGGAVTPPNLAADAAATSLELNSETSLPFHWEQCLDLKTGEIYYINWRTGMKMKEDPRTTAYGGGGYYLEEDGSSYDSQVSSSESSPSSSRDQRSGNNNPEILHNPEEDDENFSTDVSKNVLVVAGCKSCLMYYMVPKQLGICPRCYGQLLHFDTASSSSSS